MCLYKYIKADIYKHNRYKYRLCDSDYKNPLTKVCAVKKLLLYMFM